MQNMKGVKWVAYKLSLEEQKKEKQRPALSQTSHIVCLHPPQKNLSLRSLLFLFLCALPTYHFCCSCSATVSTLHARLTCVECKETNYFHSLFQSELDVQAVLLDAIYAEHIQRLQCTHSQANLILLIYKKKTT